MILAIDPGQEKNGLALVTAEGIVITREIALRRKLANRLTYYLKNYSINEIVIGQSHAGQELKNIIGHWFPELKIALVSEKNSSVEARRRYWEENKPRGLWRLVPTSLRQPPVPIDDWAAIILAERYLQG